jgi:hypothetical protein
LQGFYLGFVFFKKTKTGANNVACRFIVAFADLCVNEAVKMIA